MLDVSEIKPRGLRAPDAAKYCGMRESQLWAITRAGQLRATRLSPKCTVWLVEELDRFLNAKATESQGAEAAQ